MDEEVELIERATLAAVPPLAQRELQGWLLALDPGTVGRAHSAVPLRHEAPGESLLPAVEQAYRERGLRPVLRVALRPCFDALRLRLRAAAYVAARPTEVQLGTVAGMAALRGADGAAVELMRRPDAGWASVFLGEGFDPVDGASRIEILQRGTDAVFAAARVQGQVAAVGTACFSNGWCGVHGMRTLPAFRGRGLAAAVLAALAREAQARGIGRTLLQVEQGNAPAQALYRQAGFAPAWTYEYWS